VLELSNVSVRYGGLTALSNVSFAVPQSGFVALVGANGAGKSTLFKAICGTVPLASGNIAYEGRDLIKLATHDRARLGISHVPEGRRVFKSMTVVENIEVGSYASPSRRSDQATLKMIFDLFPRLAERRKQLAGTLSGGEQQMVAIARALAGKPRLLLLDEPSMGLAPAIVDEIFSCIRLLHKDTSLAVLLVEQRVGEALELCDTGHVLQSGEIRFSGKPEELASDGRMQHAYVGDNK
jgi:branched-chain amino acid transport system ATP-binding protein